MGILMIMYKCFGRGHAVWTLVFATCPLPRCVAKTLKTLVRCDIGIFAEVYFKKKNTPYFQIYNWFQNQKNYIVTYLLFTYFTNLRFKTNNSYKVQLNDVS